jgi:cobalt/nickel transport system ATP-binding protein
MILRVHHLNHTYRTGAAALSDISFEMNAGECAAVVGPNGAGKTTLFLRLCGALPGLPGEVIVNGLDPAIADQRKKLPTEIGVVFQNPDDQLFAATLLDDVAFGPLNMGDTAEVAKAKAVESLNSLGLVGMEERSPQRLSGGEKRRAALAGVLAMKPGVLLLDEPSMFLDPRGRRELMQLLGTLPGTHLIATHDLDLVWDCCPRTLILNEGKLVADGPTKELLSNTELIHANGLEVPARATK